MGGVRWATSLAVTFLLSAMAGAARAQTRPATPSPTFERDVLPILSARCFKCHGAAKPKSGLDLRTPGGIGHGGNNGPVLVRGAAKKSRLYEKVAGGEMPPGKDKLTETQVRIIRDWIDAGAPADTQTQSIVAGPPAEKSRPHWAFRAFARPKVPAVRHQNQVRSPIDAFLLARLESAGLAYTPDAAKFALVRRAYLDVLGLPPAPEEVDAFLADGRPGAYERLLDRLLASPQYGERWGRHWLDVVGYTDTVGFDQDTSTILVADGKWRYRDYVIAAFNDDVPFDRFVTEQLAGDELVDWRNAPRFTPEIRRLLVATGYLRTARDQTHEDVGNIPSNYFGVLHDTVAIVGNSLLGLTLNCAQCHNHKFDPITQRDYYRLMACFTPAYNPRDWRPVFPWAQGIKDRGLPDASPAELTEFDRHNREVERQAAELRGRLAGLLLPYEARLRDERLRALPEPIRADTRTAVDTPPKGRNQVQKYLAAKFEGVLKVKPEEVAAVLNPTDRAEAKRINDQIAAVEACRRSPGVIQALYDVGPPPSTYLLKRGNFETPGEEVQPGFLSVLSDPAAENRVCPVPPSAPTSGRRLALARRLTDPGSRPAALLSRVMVNRLWQHLFGQGLVPTPENFGLSGEPPSDPELLEWLADDFARSGWRIKPMIRLMMTSTAYRSQIDKGNPAIPGRMRLRRLDAEAIRDSLLAVAGRLDPSMGGPPVLVRPRFDGLVEVDAKASPAARNRRSVYLLCRRSYNLSLLTVFDQPLVALNCPARDVSAVPLQSLAMLNDDFVAEQARHFAARVSRLCPPSSLGRGGEEPGPPRLGRQSLPVVRTAFRMALARPPTSAEAAICSRLLERQTAAYREAGRAPADAERLALVQLCHTLLNTSEFLYVE